MLTNTHKSKKNKKNHNTATDLLPTDKVSRQVMQQRANLLASQKIEEAQQKQEVKEYVKIRLGQSEYYGVSYQYAKEVIDNVVLTKLPHTEKYIAGVANWRGILLTIINLCEYLHLPVSECGQASYVLVVEVSGMTVGILADDVEGSDRYTQANLTPSIHAERLSKHEYVLGLHKNTTAILNLDMLMSDIKSYLAK